MKINTFAELKRTLQVGMKLKLESTSMQGHKKLGSTRAIVLKQSNAIKFEDNSWLYLGGTGEKASDFTFQDNGFTIFYQKGTPQEDFIHYQFIG